MIGALEQKPLLPPARKCSFARRTENLEILSSLFSSFDRTDSHLSGDSFSISVNETSDAACLASNDYVRAAADRDSLSAAIAIVEIDRSLKRIYELIPYAHELSTKWRQCVHPSLSLLSPSFISRYLPL